MPCSAKPQKGGLHAGNGDVNQRVWEFMRENPHFGNKTCSITMVCRHCVSSKAAGVVNVNGEAVDHDVYSNMVCRHMSKKQRLA